MARRNNGNNDLLRFISLLTLYAILPSDKPKQGRPVQQASYNADTNVPTANSSNANDEVSGLVIFAGIFIVAGMLSGSGEFFTFCLFIAAVLFVAGNCGGSKKNNTSSADQAQQEANQPYYNPEVYGYSNAQQAVPQQSFVGAQTNVQAAQPFVPNLAKHVFVPDEGTADLLKELRISERMRYLNVDSVGELIEKFPTCIDEYDVADFREGERSIMRAKRRVVPDKYRYMPSDFNPNLVVPIAAMAAPAAAMYYDDDDNDDEPRFFGNNNAQAQQQRPAWQDPYAYHGTEKYDEFYNLREDEYREEYGEDFKDAIDDEYEDTYINK